jgi:dUTPase
MPAGETIVICPEITFAVRDDLDDKFLPTKQHESDTGWDVCCAEREGVWFKPFESATIRLGFRAYFPPNWWAELRPRSSTFVKKHLHALYGVIDEGFENEWMFACQYMPPEGADDLFVEFGERIGQIIPVRRESMLIKSVSNEMIDAMFAERAGRRGTGGFGSTGHK